MYSTWFCYTAVANKINIYKRYKKHFLTYFSNYQPPKLEDYQFPENVPWIGTKKE